jgi:hypothetical protein
MTLRDKIASTISKNITLEDGVFVGGFFDAADAIIAALPDYETQQRIKELEAALLVARADCAVARVSRAARAGWSAAHDAHVAAFLAAYLAERKKQKEKDK